MSVLYIFKNFGDFANIFCNQSWQIFRDYKICQHLFGFIANSTNFDVLKYKKCCQKSAKTENCTTFSIILQIQRRFVRHFPVFLGITRHCTICSAFPGYARHCTILYGIVRHRQAFLGITRHRLTAP